ncbi:gliding motility protein [Streptomyces subrutilus]|uniref:Gliding motility protein n=1 Tax=Streptomyces subrutilus TaxID=36818 RepID=A0A5P2UTY8_9ACTN|nr:gliding motility protein [Streptomyces subrutilus]
MTPAPESGAAEEAAPVLAEAVEAAESRAVEAVEIPKQQSAEVAADSEAGEGART